MSILLTCPNCGARDVSEFRYGGQILPPSSTEGDHFASNLPGLQRERWYHRYGCQRWLAVERDVRTNEIARTCWLSEEAP